MQSRRSQVTTEATRASPPLHPSNAFHRTGTNLTRGSNVQVSRYSPVLTCTRLHRPTVLLSKLFNRGDHPLYVCIVHIRIDRERDASCECIFRMREVSRGITIAIPGIRMQVKRNEMNASADSRLLHLMH